MNQVVEMSYAEKVAMYKKLSKEELIDLLLENQRLVAQLATPTPEYQPRDWWDQPLQPAYTYCSDVPDTLTKETMHKLYDYKSTRN